MNALLRGTPRGFTLIEILIVVIIVGILAAVALPNFLMQSNRARLTEADVVVDAIKTGEEIVLHETGRYTSSGTIVGTLAPSTITASTVPPTLNGNIVDNPAQPAAIDRLLGVKLDPSAFDPVDGLWHVAVVNLDPASPRGFAIGLEGRIGTSVRGLGLLFRKDLNAVNAYAVGKDSDSNQ